MCWGSWCRRAVCGLVLVVGVAGCGGGGTSGGSATATATRTSDEPIATAVPAPGGVVQSGGAVVKVGDESIMRSAVEARMAVEARSEGPGSGTVPVPPAFTSCIAALAAAQSGTAASRATTAQLKEACRALYRRLLSSVLTPLISAQWILGTAAEQGLSVSDGVLREGLEHFKRVHYPTEAEFRQYLVRTGESVADILFTSKVHVLEEKLRERIEGSVGRVTPARVLRYYEHEKHNYGVPEERDIGIVRSKSAARARQAEHELEAGASFAQVAKRLGEPAVYAANAEGLIVGLKPDVFAESALNDPIFAAKPHVVSGPVRLDLLRERRFANPLLAQSIDGYYVFEVESTTPAHETPFSQMKAVLSRELPELLEKKTVAAFVKTWRPKWLARTECSPGYVVRNCRQYKPAPGELAENPYALG